MVRTRYYTCDKNAERFSHENIPDAVTDYLDDIAEPETMKEVEVYVWETRKIPKDLCDSADILELIEQDLLDEYTDPEEGWAPGDDVIAAARVLGYVIRKDLFVFRCDLVETLKVNTVEWRNA